jgi:hypothetical protein
MKYFTLLGGFAGFILTLLSSYLAGNEMASALCDASVGCLLGGFMMRGLYRTMTRCFRTTMEEKIRQRREQLKQQQEVSAA